MCNDLPTHRPRKRFRSLYAQPLIEQTCGRDIASGTTTSQRSYISGWAKNNEWPKEFFESDKMQHMFSKKKPSAASLRHRNGLEKWTAYRFMKNVYDIWMPTHFKGICSAIDELPLLSEQDLELLHSSEPQVSERSGLPQRLKEQNWAEVHDNQLSPIDLQQITPDGSTQTDTKPPKQKKGKA
ncbi:hypothetical protein A1O3_06138 [Capronia epimyces CBS 606.96]|uniref:DUF7924 domain-containing protein n=1 Tax=Capronia epimyces CBS 606.96 TaxID=1182542 RepID=W9XY61_9EURO|nr:uncharacterized protein A1O3_06138 [Capronia epimyces CBS 606.96]EXJ82325.1 hypothetical protein A1O3_06138 [Capronia epimyces CBS 606.96]